MTNDDKSKDKPEPISPNTVGPNGKPLQPAASPPQVQVDGPDNTDELEKRNRELRQGGGGASRRSVHSTE